MAGRRRRCRAERAARAPAGPDWSWAPSKAQDAIDLVGRHRGAERRVERSLGYADDVGVDELRPFPRAIVGILQTAFPFQHGPAVIAVAGQAVEDAAKVDLAIADAAKASRPLDPILIAAIDTACRTWRELGVLDVKGPDPRVVAIDKAEIIHLLEQEMAGVIVDHRARMMIDAGKE